MSHNVSVHSSWVPIAIFEDLPLEELPPAAQDIIKKATKIFPRELLARTSTKRMETSSLKEKEVTDLLASFQTYLAKNSDTAFSRFLEIESVYNEQGIGLKDLSLAESANLFAELTVFPLLLTARGGAAQTINPSYTKQLRLHPEVVTYLDLSSVSGELSDEKLSYLLQQFPHLLHLILDRAIHLSEASFSSILSCHNLVILSLRACSGLLKWETIPNGSLSKLKTLNLTYLSEIKKPVVEWTHGLSSLKTLNLTNSTDSSSEWTSLEQRGVHIIS